MQKKRILQAVLVVLSVIAMAVKAAGEREEEEL